LSTYTRILEEHFEQDRGSNQVKNWNLMRNGRTKILPQKENRNKKIKKYKEDTRKEVELVKKINS
jgi:hypothetical protein